MAYQVGRHLEEAAAPLGHALEHFARVLALHLRASESGASEC
jgi:hypothetical protein